jgi:hypothetical protein
LAVELLQSEFEIINKYELLLTLNDVHFYTSTGNNGSTGESTGDRTGTSGY